MSFESLREQSKRQLARTAGFYLSVIVFGLFWLLAFNFQLYAVFVAWFQPALADTIHFVHDIALSTWVWIWGIAMLVQLYRPAKRIAAMQVALILTVIDLGVSVATGVFEPDALLFFGPVFVAAVLHPGRGELFSFRPLDRNSVDPIMLGLAALAVVPVVLYVAGQMRLQLVLTGEHAELGHYATMSYFVLSILGLALLAGIRPRGRRLAAYGAAVMAAILGLASVFQPTMSGLNPTWAAVAVLWSLVLVGTYEWSRYRSSKNRAETVVAGPRTTG